MTPSNQEFAYSWDSENRMIVAVNGSMVAHYSYDYMSRRYRKTVNGVTNNFVYDGWNLVAELSNNGSQIITNRYVWGLDLSGTLQGAGGVGGLLSVARNGVTYFPCYDANGNITDYVDINGAVVAHREYDAYGHTLVASGSMANEFSFWFSSKYLDRETGLYYYGYRYYQPELGRWCSRDPIGERGEVNLYVALANRPINVIDPDGLYTTQGTTLPDDVAGKTEFNPKITVQSVTVNHCCCSINQAAWAANTAVYYPGNANHPAYQTTTLAQILAHEGVHASSDDALAAKALPVAISALQGSCDQKNWWYALFTGWNWTESQCKSEMQSQANAAAAYIQNVAYGTLTTQAHSYIGTYGTTWNPSGIPLWESWFNGWLAGQFNGGKYW